MSPAAPDRSEVLRALEGEIVALLRRVRRSTAERGHLVDPAVSAAGYLVIDQVRVLGSCSQAEVAEALSMDKGAVSRQVQLLCELGLVDRCDDPADRRTHRLTVSEKGAARLADVDRARRSTYNARLDGWTAEDLDDLASRLARYNATLDG
jgi:DNA-binding MarR family transcriptional regulator